MFTFYSNMTSGTDQMAILEEGQHHYNWEMGNRYDQYYPGNIEDQNVSDLHPEYNDQHQTCYLEQTRQRQDSGFGLHQDLRSDYRGPGLVLPIQNGHTTASDPLSNKPDRGSKRYHTSLQPIQPNNNQTSTPIPNSPPQIGPGGRRPTIPQFDMDVNEMLKMERKRARNRIAASKCRMRKLERIAVLDQQAGQLRANNDDLKNLTEKLKAEVFELQQEIKWHVSHGCKVWRKDAPFVARGFGLPNLTHESPDRSKVDCGHHCETASPDSTTNTIVYQEQQQQQLKCEILDEDLHKLVSQQTTVLQ